MDADLAGATGVGGMPAFPPPAVPGVTRRGRGLAGAGGWAVAAQDFGFVPVPGGGGAVGVADQGPAHPVDHDVMVIPAQQDAVLQAGDAAVALVPEVVDLAGCGGLVAAACPLAELVPQLDRVADRGRDIIVGVRADAGLDPGSQGCQVPQVHALAGRAGQDLMGGVAALPGKLAGPAAQGPGAGLRYLPVRQRRHDPGVPAGPRDPGGVAGGGTFGKNHADSETSPK